MYFIKYQQFGIFPRLGVYDVIKGFQEEREHHESKTFLHNCRIFILALAGCSIKKEDTKKIQDMNLRSSTQKTYRGTERRYRKRRGIPHFV